MRTDRVEKLRSILKEAKLQKSTMFFNRLPPTTSEALKEHYIRLIPDEFPYHTPSDEPLTDLQMQEILFIQQEVGYSLFDSEKIDFTPEQVAGFKRHWAEWFCLEWFLDYDINNLNSLDYPAISEMKRLAPIRTKEAVSKLSDEAINELREKVYQEKYWNHHPVVSYDYVRYFVHLLGAFLKGEKPSSMIAKDVDFETLFTASTMQELKEVLSVKLT